MADGTLVNYEDKWIKKELRNVRLLIDIHEEEIILNIIKIKYDVILGMI